MAWLFTLFCNYFQVGLDGIRMLDPNSSRTLRIYPLETITRCEVSWDAGFCFLVYLEFSALDLPYVF